MTATGPEMSRVIRPVYRQPPSGHAAMMQVGPAARRRNRSKPVLRRGHPAIAPLGGDSAHGPAGATLVFGAPGGRSASGVWDRRKPARNSVLGASVIAHDDARYRVNENDGPPIGACRSGRQKLWVDITSYSYCPHRQPRAQSRWKLLPSSCLDRTEGGELDRGRGDRPVLESERTNERDGPVSCQGSASCRGKHIPGVGGGLSKLHLGGSAMQLRWIPRARRRLEARRRSSDLAAGNWGGAAVSTDNDHRAEAQDQHRCTTDESAQHGSPSHHGSYWKL
jgi:hypothetical protein